MPTPATDRPSSARLLTSVLIAIAAAAAGWWWKGDVQGALIGGFSGLLLAGVTTWLVKPPVPPRPVEEVAASSPEPSDFPERRISPIPRRRHEHEQIRHAVEALQQAVEDRIEALPSTGQKTSQDPLTRLADRASLHALSDWLDERQDLDDLELCLLCVALQGMEPVRARYGQTACDHALMQTAKRIRQVSREEDFIFRLSPDEFMLMVPSPAGEGMNLSQTVGRRLLSTVQRPIPYLTVSNLAVSCSVGSSVWPLDAPKLGDVLRHADAALADTRVSGRGVFKQYTAQDGHMV